MSSFELIEASRFTSSSVQPFISTSEFDATFDVVARVQGSMISKTSQVSVVSTDTLISLWSRLMAEKEADINALVGVVNWQHRVIDFNSTYTAYLLEQIDEEEFERAAEQIATEQRDRTPEEVVPLIDRILSLTNIGYTTSDFANMLECSPDVVHHALQALVATHPSIQGLLTEYDE